MNNEAHKENVRTLSQILGESEQKAAQLLEGKVAIVVDNTVDIENDLAEFLLLLLMRTVDHVQINPVNTGDFNVVISIGDNQTSKADLYVTISLEEIIIQREPLKVSDDNKESNEIWSLLGACYAAAQCMGVLVGHLLPIPATAKVQIKAVDILGDDFSDKAEFDMGTTWLAGAGAIGNAFVFALSLIKPVGELHIADPDFVEGGNLNRCICFNDGDFGKNKAKQLAHWTSSKCKSLKVIPHPFELAKVEERTDGPWLPRLVVGVDSRRVRRYLQNEIPREVFDASTTDIREIVLHFNKYPLNGLACMSCIYFQNPVEEAHEHHVARALGVSVEDVRTQFVSHEAAVRIAATYPDVAVSDIKGLAYDTLFKQLCGEGKLLAPEDKQVFAPFAFVSVLAGVLLAIEFKKRLTNRGLMNFNLWKLSPWASPLVRTKRLRETLPNCEFCADHMLQEIGNRLWS